ncbi:MAG: (d)CMP kinase [bacterium]|nr:(d)CMP kinase [bacterium]MDD5756296.1 (d)CMP kinase [bacterium]
MVKKAFIIAIDGPAGAGKSTIARMLAGKLGYVYIDSGAMYRSITWAAMRAGFSLQDDKKLVALAKETRLCFKKHDHQMKLFMNGKPVTKAIRTPKVTANICYIADNLQIRRLMVKLQQKIGQAGGIVMEGRDIGTKVFPGADFKFYLDASAQERARRRYREFKARGVKVKIQDILQDIRIRDHKDKTRMVSPLKKAKGSIVIDSSKLTPEQVVSIMMGRIAGSV